jgi:hypothetical protein
MSEPIINPNNEPNTPNNEPVIPQGKTFSEDYVKTLREESKAHRLNAKNYESKLKAVLGMNPEADLSDLDSIINQYKATQEKTIKEAYAKVNDRLIKAEIKSLDGYNHKLIEKLLDKSKIKINDNGEVEGLKEAVEELEKEFPEVKKQIQSTGGGANPANTTVEMTKEQFKALSYKERVELFQKNPTLYNKLYS